VIIHTTLLQHPEHLRLLQILNNSWILLWLLVALEVEGMKTTFMEQVEVAGPGE
jgi:hypothetical protein